MLAGCWFDCESFKFIHLDKDTIDNVDWERLNEAAEKYALNPTVITYGFVSKDAFLAGAKWQALQLPVDKDAVELLKETMEYLPKDKGDFAVIKPENDILDKIKTFLNKNSWII